MPMFRVTVNRVGYSARTIDVEADTESGAKDQALEDAGEYDYSEHDAEYEVDYVEELPEPVVDALAREALAGDDEGALDELIHELHASEASDVNNGGAAAQVAFVLERLGEEEGAKAIREALK